MRRSLCLFTAVLLLLACGAGDSGPLRTDPPASLAAPIIVDDEDWDDVANHTPARDPAFVPGYADSRGVARLILTSPSLPPGSAQRCSGFLVAPDLLMTAN